MTRKLKRIAQTINVSVNPNTKQLFIFIYSNLFFTMKNYFKIAAMALSLLFVTSCSDDHDDLSGTGKLELSFDHGYKGNTLILGANNSANSLGETLKITRFSYIVSNIRLHKTDGMIFTYPKNDSYFIINSELNNLDIDLTNVPAGDYNKITFGIGVDQEKYLTGQTEQQGFWDLAQTQAMTWAWITGYKFINFEGTFTSSEVTGERNFKVHMGSHGTALDNYREQTVSFPTVAKVRRDNTPHAHFLVDANILLDGTNKLKLSEALNSGGSAIIMVNAEKAPKVADNAKSMFVVDHIHQNGHSH